MGRRAVNRPRAVPANGATATDDPSPRRLVPRVAGGVASATKLSWQVGVHAERRVPSGRDYALMRVIPDRRPASWNVVPRGDRTDVFDRLLAVGRESLEAQF
jgi:hypothetical protein